MNELKCVDVSIVNIDKQPLAGLFGEKTDGMQLCRPELMHGQSMRTPDGVQMKQLNEHATCSAAAMTLMRHEI